MSLRSRGRSTAPIAPGELASRHLPLTRLAMLVVGTALGAVLFILLLHSVNADQLGSDFSQADYGYLALAVVPFLANLLFKVPRWALLFGDEAPGWDTLFGAMNVGYAINALLPLRLGELVRAYWIRDRTAIPMVRVLSTIAVERVTDGVTLFVLLLAMVPTVAFPARLLGPALAVGIVFVLVLVGMAVLAWGHSRRSHPLFGRLEQLQSGRWTMVGRALTQALTGLQVLSRGRAMAFLALYTVVIWVSNSILIWLVLRAFHIEVPLTAGFLLTAVLNLGMAVPSTPGYLGVFDYLMVLTLGLYGIHYTPALAAALAFHAIAFVPVTIIGLVYLARSGLRVTMEMLRTSATRT